MWNIDKKCEALACTECRAGVCEIYILLGIGRMQRAASEEFQLPLKSIKALLESISKIKYELLLMIWLNERGFSRFAERNTITADPLT